MAIGDDILIARLTNRETQLMQQADALDVKASILLVAVTFLAGQSTYFLTKYPVGIIHWIQLVSVVIQIAAALLLAHLLRIRDYSGEATEHYPAWRDSLRDYHGGDSSKMEAALTTGIIDGCIERANVAKAINNRKASVINVTYWMTLASLACNLIVLIRIAI